MQRVLFVCLGNICRSPTAEGIFREKLAQSHLAEQVECDSCGTAAYHIGKAPDARSQQAAKQQGYDLSRLRARQVQGSDFEQFDIICAMDRANYDDLMAQASPEHHHKIHLFLSFAPDLEETEVPDPYYGGEQGFKQVIKLCEAAADGLLKRLA